MRWFNDSRFKSLLVAAIAGFVLGGGRARADFTFGTPTRLGPMVNSWSDDYSPCISADGLSLYFASTQLGGYGSYDLWLSSRPTTSSEWGPAENLGPLVNSPEEDVGPAVSPDGLELYFASLRPGGSGQSDFWVSGREARSSPWGPPQNLGPPVNTGAAELAASLSADGLALYFTLGESGLGTDEPRLSLCVTKRGTKDAPWGVPVRLRSTLNEGACQWNSALSADGRLLFLCDYWDCPPRLDGCGATDIWLSMRADRDTNWTAPVNLGLPVNTPFAEDSPMISADGSTLYFSSDSFDEPAGWNNLDLWQAPILPVPDLDNDGFVGSDDVLRLMDSWGTSDPLCDIGPVPWGDGMVDVADLQILIDNWGAPETGLVAHWKLDESEGLTAHDSAGICDANLVGGPVWQPDGGMLDGALLFDGIDDYVETPPIEIHSDDSSFSLFAWVKGGGPNQVVIARVGNTILLQADHIGGNLMTVFMYAESAAFLISDTSIIDGQWHHVGLVWDADSLTRMLFVDGVVAAKDTMPRLPYPGTGLRKIRFGMWDYGSTGAWSGLIDDVRIYNRAIKTLQQQTFRIPQG